MSGTVDVEERHAAAHILARSSVFSSEQNPVSAAIVVDHRKARSRFTARGVEEAGQPMPFIGDLDSFKGWGNETPGFVEGFFKFFVGRHHVWIGFRQVNDRAAVKVGGAPVKFMGGFFALFPLEAGG